MVTTKKLVPVLVAAALFILCVGAGIVHASTFGSVQGRVTDSSGQPVAGVKISLSGEGTVTTDKSGAYVLDGVDPGQYQMDATKTGYQKTSLTVTITQDVPQELDLPLTPQANAKKTKEVR